MHIPLPTLTQRQLDRYWSQVEATDDCWLWLGRCYEDGRARIKLNGRLYVTARISYFLEHGIDPSNGKVLHTCDNVRCVNPEHLWLGSQYENVMDMVEKGRHGRTSARGTRQPNAKLTDEIVLEIRASEESQEVLRKRYGVSQSLISMVKSRRVWAHV